MKKADLDKAVSLMELGDWQAAHKIVQEDEDSPLACWAHGIVHLMEGDASNARYWYGEARKTFPSNPTVDGELEKLKAALRE